MQDIDRERNESNYDVSWPIYFKHATAKHLGWLISGYRLSSFMLLIKIV